MFSHHTTKPTLTTRCTRLLGALALAAVVAGCAATSPGKTAVRLDDTPRIAVISAFAPELTVLLPQVQQPAKHSINGVEFTTGTLEGKPVVVFLSGISMTNAAMNTQLVLDRFHVSHVVFSGIAGGVNPSLHIGDVTVPAQWGQYMEWLMAREDKPGQYSAPAWMKSELTMPAFGMMHPRPVEVRSAANPQLSKKFWFEADPKMLATACRTWAWSTAWPPPASSSAHNWWWAATAYRARPLWTTRPSASTPSRPSGPTCSTWKPPPPPWSPTAMACPTSPSGR